MALALGLLSGACAGGSSPPGAIAPSQNCALMSGPARRPVDTLVVGLTDPVNAGHAPRPRTPAERLLFRQMYETLVRVDCKGHVYSGLAASWAPEAGGRRWRFRIREGARFWDGSAATASDVVASWRLFGHAEKPPIDSALAVGLRTLVVYLRTPVRDVGAFADPGLAVARPSSADPFPLGTGPFAPVGQRGVEDAADLIVQTALGSGEGRDFLDEGVDLLLTEDRETLAYAADRPGYRLYPLSWNRTYVLVLPGASANGISAWAPILGGALAREVVRVDARASTGPAPVWGSCGLDRSAAPPLAPADTTTNPAVVIHTIAYSSNDGIARALAERLAVLAADRLPKGSDGQLARDVRSSFGEPDAIDVRGVVPEGPGDPSAALAGTGYVLSVTSAGLPSCRHGLSQAGGGEFGGGRQVVPLIDVRTTLVARTGRIGAWTDGDGAVVLEAGVRRSGRR